MASLPIFPVPHRAYGNTIPIKQFFCAKDPPPSQNRHRFVAAHSTTLFFLPAHLHYISHPNIVLCHLYCFSPQYVFCKLFVNFRQVFKLGFKPTTLVLAGGIANNLATVLPIGFFSCTTFSNLYGKCTTFQGPSDAVLTLVNESLHIEAYCI